MPIPDILHIVCYAKVVEDKEDGVYIDDVHFGGAGITKRDAERIAKNCVSTVRGGTIIPMILETTGKNQLIDIIDKAKARFRRMEDEMAAAEEIIRNNKRR